MILVSVVALLVVAGATWLHFGGRRGRPIAGLSFRPATTTGTPSVPIPTDPIHHAPAQHPFFAKEGWNNVGGGSGNAGVQNAPGPIGPDVVLHSRHGSNAPGGECASSVVTREGNLIVSCGSLAGFELNLLAPRTMELLAVYRIPQRPSTFAAIVTLDPYKAFSDTTGGAYFYLDHEERVVFADPQQQLWRVGHRKDAQGQWEFYVDSSFDLRDHVPHDCLDLDNWFPRGECDPITAVAPDTGGLLWWFTRHGRIGTVDPETGNVRAIHLEGEGIQNSVAAGMTAMYVVTDQRLLAMDASADGTPRIVWYERYERTAERKLGQFDSGSGTTPTLIGHRYVVIGDNAQDQSRLLVYRTGRELDGSRLVCTVPLFDAGTSALEISPAAWERSIIVKNEYGYTHFLNRGWEDDFAGGMQRIDIRDDESGCDVVWTSEAKTPSITPRLSGRNGLLYTYTFDVRDDDTVWSVLAIDVRTGQPVFRIPTGVGTDFDPSWAPITLHPDGTLYVGTTVGLLAVWDQDGAP